MTKMCQNAMKNEKNNVTFMQKCKHAKNEHNL